MSDIVERMRWHDEQTGGKGRSIFAEAADEIERLRKRLGPRGLEIIEIDGAGHYVNAKVRAEIEKLRAITAEQKKQP